MSQQLTDEYISTLEAAALSATTGDWTPDDNFGFSVQCYRNGLDRLLATVNGPNAENDLAFITKAYPAATLSLLAERKSDKEIIAEQAARINELEARTLTVKLPPLNDDLNVILGRPNFTCCHLAELLRNSGEDIPRKSEREQAAVIYWFLGIYLEHGDEWESVAKADIQSRAAGIPLVVGGE